jgi:hypothetical protein
LKNINFATKNTTRCPASENKKDKPIKIAVLEVGAASCSKNELSVIIGWQTYKSKDTNALTAPSENILAFLKAYPGMIRAINETIINNTYKNKTSILRLNDFLSLLTSFFSIFIY